MGGVQRRKGNPAKNKMFHKKRKTKRYVKDIDQIYDDIQPANVGKFMNPVKDESLPGFGQNYCIACSRHFISKEAQVRHNSTKHHRRRLKVLQEKPWTQKDSDECGK
eukprot:TRINITY_DN0_c1088_g1_i2.p1 TRINITY_DN0_c1088_g1~~TRINITY_DN0_c1088_g1_i2.p1  ORF type:complete len:107 (+),score=26.03 TRINITY_DN0_c1088_g1_i2:46-366(+)